MAQMRKSKHLNTNKAKAKTLSARFICINKGRQVALEVEYPENIAKYRIHEVFNQECVGSSKDLVLEYLNIKGFTKIHPNISWKVVEVGKSREDV